MRATRWSSRSKPHLKSHATGVRRPSTIRLHADPVELQRRYSIVMQRSTQLRSCWTSADNGRGAPISDSAFATTNALRPVKASNVHIRISLNQILDVDAAAMGQKSSVGAELASSSEIEDRLRVQPECRPQRHRSTSRRYRHRCAGRVEPLLLGQRAPGLCSADQSRLPLLPTPPLKSGLHENRAVPRNQRLDRCSLASGPSISGTGNPTWRTTLRRATFGDLHCWMPPVAR